MLFSPLTISDQFAKISEGQFGPIRSFRTSKDLFRAKRSLKTATWQYNSCMFQLQTFQPRKYNSKTFQPRKYNSKTLQPQDFTIPKLARLYNPKTLQPHPFQLQDHTTPILYNSRCYNPIFNNTKTNWYFHNLIQNHTDFLEHGQESPLIR